MRTRTHALGFHPWVLTQLGKNDDQALAKSESGTVGLPPQLPPIWLRKR